MFGILHAANLLADLPFPPLRGLRQRFEEFLGSAVNGDTIASRDLAVAGTFLGRVIGNHINATAPNHILILFQGEAFLAAVEQPLRDAVEAHVMLGLEKSCEITLAPVDKDWRWKGAAALALEQIYLANDVPETALEGSSSVDA
jgi:hypothetical protein